MKKTCPVFLAGFLAGVLALGALVTLTQTSAAEAQLPAHENERIVLMREMAQALKGIERALENRCP